MSKINYLPTEKTNLHSLNVVDRFRNWLLNFGPERIKGIAIIGVDADGVVYMQKNTMRRETLYFALQSMAHELLTDPVED